MNPDSLIKLINTSCKKSINNSFNLKFKKGNANFHHYIIEGTSSTINNNEMVNVLYWFDDFWLFMEITFEFININTKKNKDSQKNIKISLSIFQGKDLDNNKCQLLRAEWDDYNNFDEKHAQPHWHITSSQAIENIFSKYSNEFEKQDFLKILENEKKQIVDVKKIHFAMNADWQENKTHVHKIKNEKEIVNWLQGMLYYIRDELSD